MAQTKYKIKKAHDLKVVNEIINYEAEFGWSPKTITPMPKGNLTEYIITLENLI